MVKVNTFNPFFAKQYSLIKTGSELPADYLVPHHCLESVNLDPAKTNSIICAFDVSKAYGWDDMSVCMVKICDESLVKPLFNIFQFLLETGNFPSNCKRSNIIQVHKKGNKDLINNYRPVCLLLIFRKIYEKCIYDTLYNYFEGNDLFSKSQFSYHKGDSCVSQLLSITQKILTDFDANPLLDTCGNFWTFLRPLIVFGMRPYFSNYGPTVSQILCYVYSIVFFLKGFKDWF